MFKGVRKEVKRFMGFSRLPLYSPELQVKFMMVKQHLENQEIMVNLRADSLFDH